MVGMLRGFSMVVLASLCLSAHAKDEVTLSSLVKMTDEQLGKYDIARLNLICAQGLPGAENLKIAAQLKKLDEWTAWVKREVEKNMYRYHRAPENFPSEAYFRVAMMVTVTKQDFKCVYNPERGIDPQNPEPAETFFANSQDLFIHGFLGKEDPTGTCASFPVLFTAIGRRLDLPIKLVTSPQHLFCRYDNGKERFNIETTYGGMSSKDDDYYRNWPRKIDKASEDANGHLKSLTPKGELAAFLSSRRACLSANKKQTEALKAASQAYHLMPHISSYKKAYDHFTRITKPPKQ